MTAVPPDAELEPLSREEADAIYYGRLLPELGAIGDPVAQPMFVVIGGQQGSGKSSARFDEFAGQPVQHVIVDTIDTYVPGSGLRRPDGTHRTTSSTRRQSAQWTWRLIKRAIKSRFHVVFELASPGLARPFVELARRYGYYNELRVLAVNRHISFTAMLDRYERNPDSWVVRGRDHERCYRTWLPYVVEAENRGYFDSVHIVTRGGGLVYENHLVLRDGAVAWADAPGGFESLLLHRHRALSDTEADWLEATWHRLEATSVPLPALPDAASFDKARDRVLAYARAPGSRFDPFSDPRVASEGARDFLARIEADLKEARREARRRDAPNYDELETTFLARLRAAYSIPEPP